MCWCAALPADSYEQTKVLAPLFNTLVDKISRDGPWLKEVLKDVLVSETDKNRNREGGEGGEGKEERERGTETSGTVLTAVVGGAYHSMQVSTNDTCVEVSLYWTGKSSDSLGDRGRVLRSVDGYHRRAPD